MASEEKHIYDYLVYGATVPGIVYAVHMANQGKSVLLLNHYGFPGGSITESLACRQYVHINSLTPLVRKIFNSLVHEKNAVTVLEDNGYCFDPEAVKKVLQELLESSSVNLLYHVLPVKVFNTEENVVQIDLSAKEGMYRVGGKTVLDASDEQLLSALSDMPEQVHQRVFNLFIHSEKTPVIKAIIPRSLIKVSHNRYWASFEIPQRDGVSVEGIMQEEIDVIASTLQEQDARIQLLPVRPGFTAYTDFNKGSFMSGLIKLTDLIQKTNPQYFVFTNAAMLESRLDSGK
jgi:flavin-dependent dehydrogenase